MKKFFEILLMVLLFSGVAFAGDNDANLARNIRDNNIMGAYGIADVSDADTLEVTDSGSIKVHITDDTTDLDINTDGSIEVDIETPSLVSTGWTTSQVMVTTATTKDTGAGVIQTISLYSNAADAYALVYDNTAQSGTLLYDIVGGANVTTVVNFEVPIQYSTGVNIAVSAESDIAQVTWKSTD